MEDEILTAGLSPFQYRDISENRFRTLHSDTTDVRKYYKLGVVGQIQVCAFCGSDQMMDARGGGKQTKCEKSGKSLPYDDI